MLHNKGNPAILFINIEDDNKGKPSAGSFIHATIPGGTQIIQAKMILVIHDETVARENTTREYGSWKFCEGFNL